MPQEKTGGGTIQVLPAHIANQIAAGEVIQRPASVVKELLENALDAGADKIQVSVKDAGKTLILVRDNGCGMSAQDARLCFERHATSKLREASDLFEITTRGFRGEALASMAAVAQVELQTSPDDTGQGTKVIAADSAVKSSQTCAHPRGSTFQVRHLFYNTPARRNFLKSPQIETRHIIEEVQRIALAHPQAEIHLDDENKAVYRLSPSIPRQRVIHIFGKGLEQKIVPIEEETQELKISGFIGRPRFARKSRGDQFLFVNKRFIRSPYLHHCILSAYQGLLAPDTHPFYVIFLEVDPKEVDVNVHPAKTEVKFRDESHLYALLRSAVRHSLGLYQLAPPLDFESSDWGKDSGIFTGTGATDNPFGGGAGRPGIPETDPEAPFEEVDPDDDPDRQVRGNHWESYYQKILDQAPTKSVSQQMQWDGQGPGMDPGPIEKSQAYTSTHFWQAHGRYIFSMVKSGIMVIDPVRARQRIIFESLLDKFRDGHLPSQQELFPRVIEVDPAQYPMLESLLPALKRLGMDLSPLGVDSMALQGVPAGIDPALAEDILEEILDQAQSGLEIAQMQSGETLARLIALRGVGLVSALSVPEMQSLADKLFACSQPERSPDGKACIYILSLEQLQNWFNKT